MAYINGKEILNVICTGGASVDVDQEYNPESANPQSGKAVAEAIAGVTTETLEVDFYGKPKTVQKAVIDLDSKCNKLTFAKNVNYEVSAGNKTSLQNTLDLIFSFIETTHGVDLRSLINGE